WVRGEFSFPLHSRFLARCPRTRRRTSHCRRRTWEIERVMTTRREAGCASGATWLLSTFCTPAGNDLRRRRRVSPLADRIQMFSDLRCWYGTCPTHAPTRVRDKLIAVNQMGTTTPYLDCLGCGVVLYGARGAAPKTLCADCRMFAAIARGTHCRQCGSTTVLCCTEPDGFQTLFCTACDHVWCSARSSIAVRAAVGSSNC